MVLFWANPIHYAMLSCERNRSYGNTDFIIAKAIVVIAIFVVTRLRNSVALHDRSTLVLKNNLFLRLDISIVDFKSVNTSLQLEKRHSQDADRRDMQQYRIVDVPIECFCLFARRNRRYAKSSDASLSVLTASRFERLKS